MASNVTTQGQEAIVCDLCQGPVAFFCRHCGINLCDPCVRLHLRVKSRFGHDVVDYSSKDDDECSIFCKTICEYKSQHLSELSVKVEDVLKIIAKENGLLQSFRHKLETSLDQLQKYLKREVEEKNKGLMKRFLKNKYVSFFLLTLLNYFLFISQNSKGWISTSKIDENDMQNYIGNIFEKMLESKLSTLEKRLIPDQGFPTAEIKINENDMQKYFANIERMLETKFSMLEKRFIPDQEFPSAEIKIDDNDMQNHFANIEKMLETKFSILEKRLVPDPDSGRKVLEVPSVSSVIDTGFSNKYYIRLNDMAVTDDKKVWVGGYNNDLKLFDLKGNFHRRVTITWHVKHICMYTKQLLYSDPLQKSVNKIADDDTVVTMFTTGDWEPYGITGSASGDLLVCLRKYNQSKVVRYSSTGTVLQEIQYDSQSQPLYQAAWYIAENVNWDIIVTDYAKHKVIVVDIFGKFRYIYPGTNNDLYAGSVATDSVGHVYITDYIGNKIHMLDKDGGFLRYIVPERGIECPIAIGMIGDSEMVVGERHTGLAKRIRLLE